MFGPPAAPAALIVPAIVTCPRERITKGRSPVTFNVYPEARLKVVKLNADLVAFAVIVIVVPETEILVCEGPLSNTPSLPSPKSTDFEASPPGAAGAVILAWAESQSPVLEA